MSDLEGFLKQILGDRQNERPELVAYLRKMDEDAKKYPNEPVLISKTTAEDVDSHFRSLEGVDERLHLVENLGLMYFPEKGTIAIGTKYASKERGDSNWQVIPGALKLPLYDIIDIGKRAKTSFTSGCAGVGREVVVAQSGCEVFFGYETIERYIALNRPCFDIWQNPVQEGDRESLGEKYPDTALMFSYARALRELGMNVPDLLAERYRANLVKSAIHTIKDIGYLAAQIDQTFGKATSIPTLCSVDRKWEKRKLMETHDELMAKMAEKVAFASKQEWLPLDIQVHFAGMKLIPREYLAAVVKTYNLS